MKLLTRLLIFFFVLSISDLFLVRGDRYQDLLKIKNESPNGIINFNFTGYQYYVLMEGRNYDLFILFTGTHKSCPSCKPSTSNFEVMAINCYNQMNDKPSIFFGFIYVDKVENVIGLHKLRYLPAIIYIESTKQFIANRLTFKRESQWRIPEQKDTSSLAMINFVNSRTGNNFEIILSFNEKVKRISFLLLFVVIIIAIIYNVILLARNKPFIIMILATLICSFSMSGLVYSIQHGKYQSRDFFVRNPRVQNFHEGILMSVLMTISSLLLFIAPFIIHGKLSIFKKKISRWSVSLIIMLFLTSILSIYYGYKLKVAWYSPTFYPPAGYLKGPLLVDRGNSF